jgi:uncharacterized protein (DUF302 family)/ketosteroid isomerase-like protein
MNNPHTDYTTKDSPWPVTVTVERLTETITERGLTIFATIDQRAAASSVGLELRETVLIIFGNPAAGTPVMDVEPLAALDLPLRLLVWDENGQTRVSYVTPAVLAARFSLPAPLAAPLAGIELLTDAALDDGSTRDPEGAASAPHAHTKTAGPAPRTEAERNRSTMTAAFEAWRDAGSPITEIFAPEMTWRIVGHSAASRAYADKHEFIEEVLAPFARRFSTTDPFRPVTVRGVYADGDTVIVFWDGRGTTIKNTTYENTYAWLMRMQGGQVVDGYAFYDSISFNELWAGVTPGGPTPPR